ncbi:hypothetical protein YC2023_020420 [Brassica napus]
MNPNSLSLWVNVTCRGSSVCNSSSISSTSSVNVSTQKVCPSIVGFFSTFSTLYLIAMSPRRKSICPFCTSIMAPAVAKNGLPKMRGSLGSSSSSRTTKSVITYPFPTPTGMFSSTPTGLRTDRSARTKEILVGL